MRPDTERRTARCISCDAVYPTAAWLCPNCGAPVLQGATENPHTVWVAEVAAMRQRADLAARLTEVLDCDVSRDEVERALAAGETAVCSDLSRESAQVLVEYLQRQRVAARLTAGPVGTGRRSLGAWLGGAAPVAAGVLLDVLTASPFPLATGIGAAVSGGAFGVSTLSRRRRARPPLCRPLLPPDQLGGWSSMGAALSRLLRTLDAEVRDNLAAVAMAVAFIQDELCGTALMAFAAGGRDGGLDKAAQALLLHAIERGRKLGGTDGQDAVHRAAIAALAAVAERARVSVAGGGPDAPALRPAPTDIDDETAAVIARLQQEINKATEALSSVQR